MSDSVEKKKGPAEAGEAKGAGKVRALPGAAGSYRVLLIAEETGVAGQLVLARPAMVGVVEVEE